MQRLSLSLALTAALLAVAAPVPAHPDHGAREEFPGEGVAVDDQHGGEVGHLPAVQRNVELVGKGEVSAPGGGAPRGRVADVSAYGNYAYLTSFRRDNCLGGGAWVMDISDPRNPVEVGFLPTTDGSYAGEGSQTIRVKNSVFDGVLFIHQNETCPTAPAPTQPRTRGGINIWNVTDPTSPELLVAHAGDYTLPSGAPKQQASSTHSAFAWNNKFNGRTYVVLVDNEEFTDVDIMDITDPRNPVMVNDTLNLTALFGVDQPTPSTLTSVFLHDMVVKRIGERYVMSASYWDGGYVLLDVTDPTPGNVTLIAESDYATLDEERLARGHEIAPEGNAHQSELSPDNRFLVATDEDFNAFRAVARITSGPYAGTEYTATSASDTPPISGGTRISGTPTFVGEACGALPPGSGVALVERGTCSFQVKLDNIVAAGYTAGIVFNTVRPDCMSRVTMLASGAIPYVFVDRLTGLKLLQVGGATAGNACTTPSPGFGAPAASTTIESVFDGWGYVRLFRTHIPGEVGVPGSITQVDTFAIPESQDPAYAIGFGDLSVHEVAIDPNPGKKLAYMSYYSGGFRVLKFGDKGLEEVGAFIDRGGSNFWGVEVHQLGKQQYVLASDRDFGLYIFRYTG
jgi:hypothetical protein